MYNAFFKARPRLRAALFGLAVCTPSLMVGLTAAFAETPAAVAPAIVSDRLSVEVVGTGPDVILIPGYGCSREVWRATAERLKATHRVHLVQLAGFAGQPWTHGDGPLLEPAVEALAAYVQTAGLQKPAVIGHSMGGLSALMLA
ncbi:MAG: alpha/beta hydrolase, partial [Pseudomonadota bacterium]|nr:alpha/beta hydrolase [Pseudomonadota bacterium]